MQRSSDEYADLISIPCGNNLEKKIYYFILHVSHDLKEDIISVFQNYMNDIRRKQEEASL